MTSDNSDAGSASKAVLGLVAGGMPAFVLEQVGQRQFSKTIAELNRDYLTGTPEQKALARRALNRLGFPEE